MIGQLPKTLYINGVEYKIQSDFHVILTIFQAYNDPELTDYEKNLVMLKCLYDNFETIPGSDYEEAIKQAIWFMDGGKVDEDKVHSKVKKIIDWEQDEQIMFPAINKVAGYEIRTTEYLHWWTFLGFFYEIGEGLFSTVINIRQKKIKGKKLEKYEQEFYRDNRQLIDFIVRYSEEEQAEIDRLNKLLG